MSNKDKLLPEEGLKEETIEEFVSDKDNFEEIPTPEAPKVEAPIAYQSGVDFPKK